MVEDEKMKSSLSSGTARRRRYNDVAIQTLATQTLATRPTQEVAPSAGCSRLSVCFLSAVIAVLAALGAVVTKGYELRQISHEMLVAQLGPDVHETFNAYDRDMDGYLSLAEFEPLINKLGTPESMAAVDFDSFMDDIDPALEVLSVEAHFQPLRQETMTKERDGYFTQGASSMDGLDSWTSVYRPLTVFGVPQFAAFLPDGSLPVGQLYDLIPSKLSAFSSTLSSNRYYPPRATGREVLIFRLLSMFHERPFIRSRFGPQGAVAVIRAENEMYVDVVFRIHAEFQLNEPPVNPFWFTPAQFAGNLIIRRDLSHIEHFQLYVPNNRSLNVDLEWMNGPMENENMEVDIGYMPQMEITVPSPSSIIAVYGEDGAVIHEAKAPIRDLENDNISWNTHIPMEDALRILDHHFYPFKKVPYLPFAEAFQEAAAKEKLVHSILLWGALDDQSC